MNTNTSQITIQTPESATEEKPWLEAKVNVYGVEMTTREALVKCLTIQATSSKSIRAIMDKHIKNAGKITPKDEQEEISYVFFESNLSNSYLNELMYMANETEKYNACQDVGFLALKAYVSKNVEKWFHAYHQEIENRKKPRDKKRGPIYNSNKDSFIRELFNHKLFKAYFKNFIFSVENGHNQDLYSKEKNRKINFKLDGFAFRYFESVEKTLDQEIELYNKHKVVNLNRIVQSIFLPNVSHGCFVCEVNDTLTFNHQDKTIVPFSISKQCHDITDTIHCEITTHSGSIVIMNDARYVLSQEKANAVKEANYANCSKYRVSPSVNCLVGQAAHMNNMADELNISYSSAGNFGCNIYASKDGFVFSDTQKEGCLGSFSMPTWGFSIMDAELFHQFAKESGKNIESLDFIELKVKPGTYTINSHLNFFEEADSISRKSFKKSIFASMVFKNDNTEHKKMTDDEWKNNLGIIPQPTIEKTEEN